MKKIIFVLLFVILLPKEAMPCAGGDWGESYYYLFMQEMIDEPEYYPFLYNSYERYYTSADTTAVLKNENIEQWSKYLNLTYEQAEYLVFKASEKNVRALIKEGKSGDEKLDFANADFSVKNKQALLYIAYAKYLEPYMQISFSSSNEYSWYYRDENTPTAANLDYDKVINVLKRSWAAETDKELKLRYGYQLVRFAHYNRKYAEAINFFISHVESLNYKTTMYYYALDQYAGAQRALGYIEQANYNFFQVFVHSKNLKESVLTSIQFTENASFHAFLAMAKTKEEKINAYFLLGYMSFNDPIVAAKKIVEIDPNAIQAKVLMTRAINEIETSGYRFNAFCLGDDCFKHVNNKQQFNNGYNDGIDKPYQFLQTTLAFSSEMASNKVQSEKNFWNLTSAYLYFTNNNYAKAKTYLAQVKEINDKYKRQKRTLAMFIDLSEQAKITPQIEDRFYATYFAPGSEYLKYDVTSKAIDVLANRYLLQGDTTKSYLLRYSVLNLEYYPDISLMERIETLYNKKGKTGLEKFIIEHSQPANANFDLPSYLNFLRADSYLANGDFKQAIACYNKMKQDATIVRNSWERDNNEANKADEYDLFNNISSKVFGYNTKECFECAEEFMIKTNFLSDFSFIRNKMNKMELAESLLKLDEIAKGKNELAAKANYLLGNFYYNVTRTGYFRHLLRYDINNGYCSKYDVPDIKNVFNNSEYGSAGYYYSYYMYGNYYPNNVSLSEKYLQKAYSLNGSDEFKAKVVFALSKCEQENYYDSNEIDNLYWHNANVDGILITDRKYFADLMKYQNTAFFKEVESNCLYFGYYVNNVAKK